MKAKERRKALPDFDRKLAQAAAKDVRSYTAEQLKVPDGGRSVPRTLVAMSDGTNAPCTKADTAGVPGKNGGEAGSRQLRVSNFCEYAAVTEKGVPVPIRGSFSYAVMHGDVGELTGQLKRHGVARGSGTVPRMPRRPRGSSSRADASRRACTGDFTTRPASAPSSQG